MLQLSSAAPLPAAPATITDLSQIDAIVGATVSSLSGVMALRPMFQASVLARLAVMTQTAVARTPGYVAADFSRFLYLRPTANANLNELVQRARAWPHVERAYLEGPGRNPAEPPDVNFEDDAAFSSGDEGVLNSLKFLDAAPTGINAKFAWQHKGQGATDVTFADIERGWDLAHPDLAGQPITSFNDTNDTNNASHGTSVLGIAIGADNSQYAVGVAPYTGKTVVVGYDDKLGPSQAIADSLGVLNFGDVLLIEIQVPVQETSNTKYLAGPVDAYYVNYLLIQLATALGITVVQAGGNGTLIQDPETEIWDSFAPALNMDAFSLVEKDGPITPLNPAYRDSGSIMVSAAHAAEPHQRCSWAPYGKRVDCYAWGDGVFAPAQGDSYTKYFPGTSAASAIVAGAALATQSAAIHQLSWPLNPAQMRYLLSTFGTPSGSTEAIGVMPDLEQIIGKLKYVGLSTHLLEHSDLSAPALRESLQIDLVDTLSPKTAELALSPPHSLGLSADLFVRDHEQDDGTPHAGSVTTSPDIIVMPAQLPEPFEVQSVLPPGTPGGSVFVPGQDNFIYLRVHQGNQISANSVTASVYAAPLAVSIAQGAWTQLGTVTTDNIGALASIVMPAVLLPANMLDSDLPLVILCVIEGGAQETKLPGDWGAFKQLVQSSHHVAARLLVAHKSEADASTDAASYQSLPFAMPGNHNRRLPMVLEVSSRLAEGSRIRLDLRPAATARRSAGALRSVAAAQLERAEVITIQPNARVHVGPLALAARSRNNMRLWLDLPRQAQARGGWLSVRQLLDGDELGRLTWQL